MIDLAKEMYALRAAFGTTYTSISKEIDRAELEADEDLEKLSEVTQKRMKLKETEPHLDMMVKQLMDMEDELVPETIDILNTILTFGEAENE